MVKNPAPDIEHFGFYLTAFQELNTCRPSSMGMASIPFTAIHEYYKILDIGEHEEFDEFLYYMRVMDTKYLQLEHQKETEKNKPKAK